MNCEMEINEGAFYFDVENSLALLLGFRKYYRRWVIIQLKELLVLWVLMILTFTVVISGVKVNGNNTDIHYTFNLIEPPGYMTNIIPNNVLYQNVTKERIEYIEFLIRDEHGRPIDSNDDA